MTVQLALTCLVDGFRGRTGVSAVRVLEHAGCKVLFNEAQACCGQPAFNAGDWPSARRVASAYSSCFEPGLPVVFPSGSCAAMVHEGFKLLGMAETFEVRELCQFLVENLQVKEWPALPTARTVVAHPGCHGRMLGSLDSLLRILACVPNLKVERPSASEQCCGFGGSFSVSHPTTSRGIGLEKLAVLSGTGVTEVVSTDWGCLLHLEGLAQREGIHMTFTHVADLLAEALD